MLSALLGALLAVPRRAPLQPDADRDASWQPFADYLSTKGVETIYNCGFESVATACPEVASDAVPRSGYGDVSDLMVPAGEHVLLVGSSHMRSIAELIMAAHRFSNDEPQKSHTRDSNDCMLNQTAAELQTWQESASSTGHMGQCGLFDQLWDGQQLAGQACQQSDYFTATFPSGGSLTTVANYADWQLGDDEPSILDRISQDIDARKVTHAIYSPHHDKSWFYGRCTAMGAPLDPHRFGFSHEPGCELTPGHVEDCTRAAPLFQLLSEKLPGRVTLLMPHVSFDTSTEKTLLQHGARPAVWLLPKLREFPCLLKDQNVCQDGKFPCEELQAARRPGKYTGPCLDRAATLNETLECVTEPSVHACIVACDREGCHMGPGVAFAQIALDDVRQAARDTDAGTDAGGDASGDAGGDASGGDAGAQRAIKVKPGDGR